MYTGPDKFDDFAVDVSSLPLLLNADAKKKDSVTSITRKDVPPYSKFPRDAFLHVINADYKFDYTNPSSDFELSVLHPFATDSGGSICRLVDLTFANAIPTSFSKGAITHTAFLTEMRFYKDEENPFVGAKEYNRTTDRMGYPYIPPKAFIEKAQFPFKVELVTFFDTESEIDYYIERVRKTLP